jgi:hypothetical protein
MKLGLALGAAAALSTTCTLALADSEGAAPSHLGSVFVDPLGFLLFGPTLGAEIGTGHFTGTAYGRWFSGGLLSRQFFLNHAENDSFGFSYGIGGRARYYVFSGMAGPHVGVSIEYLATRVEDPQDLVATNSRYVVPAVEGGYRLSLFRTFYVGAAAEVGYAVRVGSSVEDLPGGNEASFFTVKDESRFYASASLDLGVYF